MTSTTATAPSAVSVFLPVLFAATLGIGLIFLTGHLQAESLHAATHDVRHANGFPCH